MQLSCCERSIPLKAKLSFVGRRFSMRCQANPLTLEGQHRVQISFAGIAVQARTRDFKKGNKKGICLSCRVSNSAVLPFYLIREAIGKLNLFWYVYLPSAAIHQ
ncbi:hypothetical protein SLA2020_030770 [Shorea laevis]